MIGLRTAGTIELGDVRRGFRSLLRSSEGAGAKAFFQVIKKPARKDVAEHQKHRRGESGSWPSLDPDTLAKRARRKVTAQTKRRRRRRGARKNTKMLGRLPRAWKFQVTDDSFRMINRVRWSAVHDQGGTAGHGARIPKRQFAYFSRGFVQDAALAYRTHMARAWRR